MPVIETINHALSEPFELVDIQIARSADGRTTGTEFRARALTYDRKYRVSDNGMDWYTEVWKPSAFKKSIAQDVDRGRKVPLHWNHDAGQIPLGHITEWDNNINELTFTARFAGLGDPTVARVAELVENGVIRGVSIGARVYENERAAKGSVERVRTSARIDEISLVMSPGLEDALVGVSAGDGEEGARSDHDRVGHPRLDHWTEQLARFQQETVDG